MALLDAALAFALTLAALATVVTILMEIAIRVVGLRKSDQVTLIKRLYDDHLAPSIGITTADAAARWDFVRKVLQNPLAGTAMAPSEQQQKFAGTRCSPIYDEISVEHLLRRVMEMEQVKGAYNDTERALKERLTTLAQKYDEYRSAISTSFKCRAQFWSLILGIVVAVVMNVDGVRLFQTYLDNPEQTAEVVGKMDQILQNVEDTQKKLRDATAVEVDKGTLDDMNKSLDRLGTQVTLIQGFELPIGRLYYPYCGSIRDAAIRATSSDPLCGGKYSAMDSLAWLIKAVVTGLLIGLGAPFWYDVAKRLAEVRRAFGGRGSALQRHGGSDGTAKKEEDRGQLIERIVRDIRG